MKKKSIIETINIFPKDVILNELFEQLIIKEKIEMGLKQIDKGQTISHKKLISHFNKKSIK